MDNFERKMHEGAENIIGVVNDTLMFEFDFRECFPATTYVIVEKNGKKYQLKLEATLRS